MPKDLRTMDHISGLECSLLWSILLPYYILVPGSPPNFFADVIHGMLVRESARVLERQLKLARLSFFPPSFPILSSLFSLFLASGSGSGSGWVGEVGLGNIPRFQVSSRWKKLPPLSLLYAACAKWNWRTRKQNGQTIGNKR